jgi:hypothetical protein
MVRAWRFLAQSFHRHREPPLGGVAIQGKRSCGPLDCFVAPLLAMTGMVAMTGASASERILL